MHDLPGSLRLTSTFPFVGRSAELATLRALMPRAEGEGRRVVLLGGEPGSGKSRLVREFAAEAAGDGALVLYGACDAVVRTPYGPFVEALDQLARVTDPAELRAALGTAGGELTRLLPDLPARVGELPPPVEADPDTERHRLHTAVTDLLAGVSRRRPVLLVLEDGHWADAPTLLLLRHLARAAGDARLLAARHLPRHRGRRARRRSRRRSPTCAAPTTSSGCGSRASRATRWPSSCGAPPAATPAPACRSSRGRSATSPTATRSSSASCGARSSRPACVEIVDGTIRLTRPLAELGTPESVREVVEPAARRAWRPGPPTCSSWRPRPAAEFELDVVRRAAGVAEPELLAALDEAVRSGMIEELPSRRLAYRFTHELVRRALYDRLTGVRRAELHLRVGEALESADGRSGRALADLAHHFAAAAPFGGAERGVEYNVLAARAATAALAFDEAAERLRTALELRIESPPRRAEVLLELGTASHRAGKALDALEAFGAAAEIARELGDAELLARAAIGYEDACWRPGIADQGAVELLEEAAAALGDESSELRVGLLGGLARALDFQGDHERGGDRAHERGRDGAAARRPRRPRHRARCAPTGRAATSSLEEILAMLTEASDLGEELGDTEIRAEAMAWRVPAFVALGDLDAARREVAVLLRDRRADGAAVHAPRRRALRLGDRAVRRPARGGRGDGASARTSGAGC